jgi:DNA-directed RNA polymerase subunit RPC12/RpoP
MFTEKAVDSKEDNLEKLSHVLYGRRTIARDWLGGSNATILLAAVYEINRLRAELKEVVQNTSSNKQSVPLECPDCGNRIIICNRCERSF